MAPRRPVVNVQKQKGQDSERSDTRSSREDKPGGDAVGDSSTRPRGKNAAGKGRNSARNHAKNTESPPQSMRVASHF